MYIATPLYLKFYPNSYVHTVHTVERFKENDKLQFNVKAYIGKNREEALNNLIAAVKKEWISRLKMNHSTISDSDFELIYSGEEIVDGRVWSAGGTSSSVRLID